MILPPPSSRLPFPLSRLRMCVCVCVCVCVFFLLWWRRRAIWGSDRGILVRNCSLCYTGFSLCVVFDLFARLSITKRRGKKKGGGEKKKEREANSNNIFRAASQGSAPCYRFLKSPPSAATLSSRVCHYLRWSSQRRPPLPLISG